MKHFLLTIAFSLVYFPLPVKAQGNRAEIKARPLVQLGFECTKKSLYPGKQLNRLVRSLINETGTPSVFGERAFAFDLNGDKANEYFVPFECGAIGFNCQWGIFALRPARLLGLVGGEYVYIHKRVGRWSQLTVTRHITSSDSEISKSRFLNSRYRRFGKAYETSAYRDDFPRSLLTVDPICDPHYRPEKAKQRQASRQVIRPERE
jgi:hypothetical protein